MVKFLDWIEIPLPDFMNNQYGEFLILLAIWLLIGFMVVLVVRPIIRSLFAKTKTDLDDRVMHIIEGPVILIIFFYGIVASLDILDAIPHSTKMGLFTIYKVTVSLVVVYLAYKVFRTIFMPLGSDYAKKKGSTIDKTLLPVVETLGGTLILILGLFWVLSSMGVEITVFLAGIGVVGLVLAFALQDTLSNYFSGLHLMLDRPFDIGDTLQVDDKFLRVRKIGFRSTRLYNIYRHEIVIMPNNVIANLTLVNLTQPDLEYRIRIDVGVAYGSSVEKVKEILFEAVHAQEETILDDPNRQPVVRFKDFGESALKFRVAFFIHNVFDQWAIGTKVREHIDRRFHEEGIIVPFPQRTVSFLGPGPEEELKAAPEPIAPIAAPL